MFEFLGMANDHAERLVDSFKIEGLFVSTVRVNDGKQPYETAICHPDYNDDKLIVVEAYDSKEEAKAGHAKWVLIMTADDLPNELTDCCNAGVAQWIGVETFKRQPK